MSLNNLYYTLNEFLLLTTYDPLILAGGGRLIIGSHDNQNTSNLTNSIRAQFPEYSHHLIQADRQHRDTSKGKL